MKKEFLLLIVLIIGVFIFYSETNRNAYRHYNELTRKELLQSEIENKHNRIQSGIYKFDNPSAYFNYHVGIRKKGGESNSNYLIDYRNSELRKARNNVTKNKRVSDLEFIERGPFNTPGRSRSMVILPSDPTRKTWLLGSVGGGIWKTTDGGDNWVNKTSKLPSLAITSFAFCPANPSIIYAGTGESIGGSVGIIGSGVFKSNDEGETWDQLSSTNNRDFAYINRIAVHPSDPSIVLLCTSGGPWDEDSKSRIYKSIDGGDSWNEVFQSNNTISQVIFNNENPNTIYATHWGSGVLKSTDLGETWIEKEKGFSKVVGRVEIAISPTDTSWLYASTVGNAKNALYDLYLSANSGESWKLVDQKYKSIRLDLLGGQGDYDNTISVNPFNKKIAYYGGVNLWKTTVMDLETSEVIKDASLHTLDEPDTFWDFINFGADYSGGKLEISDEFELSEYSSVQIISGPGIKQKAHRFSVEGKGSGVPDDDYLYKDYVDIPFQIWDINNDKQLMVSFRDQQEDGNFNLIEENTQSTDASLQSREYLFIHNIEYSEIANDTIAQDGGNDIGHTYKQIYFIWPVLKDGESFDGDNLPEDTLEIELKLDTLNLIKGELENISDAYLNYDKKNISLDTENGQFILHPDHHFLHLQPIDQDSLSFQIYDCNDGGIYISNIDADPGINDGDWSFRGFGVNSGQFYGADKMPGQNVFIGGMQDNGTWLSPDSLESNDTTIYNLVLGGDGFEVIWNYKNPQEIIGSSQFNGFGKTVDGGKSWYQATNGIEGNSPFISKLTGSPSKPNTIFTVTSLGVYKSENFGDSWKLALVTEDWGFSSFLDVEVSLSNYNIIWAGSGMSSLQKLHVSVDGGDTFEPTNNFQENLGNLSGLSTHPFDDSVAYVLFSFNGGPKILRTEDLGLNWEDITGFSSGNESNNGFPNVAVYDLLVRPDNPEILWAGTEIGIFESIDNGENWEFLDNELGGVAIWKMKVVDDKIVIATHGRGIWTATLDQPIVTIYPPTIFDGGTKLDNDLFLHIELNSSYDSTYIYAGDILVHKIGESSSTNDSILIIPNPELQFDEYYQMKMVSYRNGKVYPSESKEIIFFKVGEVTSDYVCSFNDLSDEDFIGKGFTIDNVTGFSSGAIHSDHPYFEAVDLDLSGLSHHYYFKKPVKINNGVSKIRYRDIAIIETGEQNSIFGQQEFYDYVVIEGSKNGYEWKNIDEGYDAGKFSTWLNAYENNKSGDSTMFRTQEFDILDAFNKGDTILIRFKLYSDQLTNGWGWAIDDLIIQSSVVTSLDEKILSSGISVFPNPADGSFKVKINSSNENEFQLTLLDINGKVVSTIQPWKVKKGWNELDVERGRLLNGVYFLSVISESGESALKKIIFK